LCSVLGSFQDNYVTSEAGQFVLAPPFLALSVNL